jgi:molybdenum cofactor cytidylyltransferase
MKIGAIILSAGASTRMGEPKQLLKIGNETLVRRAINTVRQALPSDAPSVLVLGANASLIAAEIQDLTIESVINLEWQSGMASSIRSGLNHLLQQSPDLQAVIIILIDQPLLKIELLNELISQFQNSPHQPLIVASEYNQTLGVPALFSQAVFADLLNLSGEAGARKVIQKYMTETAKILFLEGALDIDTPADYARIKEILDAKTSF